MSDPTLAQVKFQAQLMGCEFEDYGIVDVGTHFPIKITAPDGMVFGKNDAGKTYNSRAVAFRRDETYVMMKWLGRIVPTPFRA